MNHMMSSEKNRYAQLMERIFLKAYKEGIEEVLFSRDDIKETAGKLKIELPKNIGDLVYSFRYRVNLPASITDKAKPGFEWIIRPSGRGKYKLALAKKANFSPNPNLAIIKIPDATPGIVEKYSYTDEQALLAKVRYNRLIDIFTGVTCYSLQNHLRTTLTNIGQVETDEIYLGVDKNGVHYVFPVQAKGGADRIGTVQIEQDFELCKQKFPQAIGRPIAVQFAEKETIVLFEFIMTQDGIRIASEKHYRLVRPNDLSEKEIKEYQRYLVK